jgi:DNA-directed RNA polymerase subunit M/transcription elongation factor TFIIS
MTDHELRVFARSKFAEVFPGKPIKAKHAEIGVYNWTVENTVGKQFMYKGKHETEQPSWENALFRMRYKQRLMSVLFNLDKNPDLLNRIKAQDLENLTPGQMWPDGPLGQTERKIRERETAIELAKAKMESEYEGILKCPKCKSHKTSYFQLQTRSADEVRITSQRVPFVPLLTPQQPMTTYAECLCGNKWKF